MGTRVPLSVAKGLGLGLIRCHSNSSISSITSMPRIFMGCPPRFSLSSSPQKAQLVLEWRLEKILNEREKNPGCYSELISMCGKIRNVPLAMEVFPSMEANGIKPTSGIFNALILACFSSYNVITALSLFEVMDHSDACKPNSDTYNTFISAFANLGNDKATQAWYSSRKAAGFSADLQTYESLIFSCFKCKNFDGVDRFYEEMVLSAITPNIPILEMVLVGHCERRNRVKSKEFFKFILDGGWEINVNMAEKLVGLYCDLGDVKEMEELLTILMKSKQDSKSLCRVHFGIIRMYAALDRLDDVEYSVGRMLRQGIMFQSSEDVHKVICSYFRRAAYDRLDLFLECIRGSYKLTRSSYDLLVAGYRRAGLDANLETVMNDMKMAGFL
ncbi:hypothetical protein Acr_00g0067780 [Actinidia rufa]|uniref:Tetratricopeptide repeat (TPR)-like superfamily protein n=2 Tax=Actinidia rufa TaxID=165716 RepID=A0A7J0DR15_9ERIC|nr:hypothetical protein Acr_00g0067780 [Actinidia rufa]